MPDGPDLESRPRCLTLASVPAGLGGAMIACLVVMALAGGVPGIRVGSARPSEGST